MSQQIECELDVFSSAGLRQINCLPEHKVPVSGEKCGKRELGCLDLTAIGQILLFQLMRSYFLLFEAR